LLDTLNSFDKPACQRNRPPPTAHPSRTTDLAFRIHKPSKLSQGLQLWFTRLIQGLQPTTPVA